MEGILRAQHPDWDDQSVRAEVAFASPEDVILKKMAFYRDGRSEKHLRDIAGILKISSGGVDLTYIGEWAKKLDLEEIWASFPRPR